jgi:hypothetical protein
MPSRTIVCLKVHISGFNCAEPFILVHTFALCYVYIGICAYNYKITARGGQLFSRKW